MICWANMLNPIILFFPISLILFVYSYGFVDFNLTLSSNSSIQNFVSWSQQLAMFHRSTSIYIHLGIIIFLYLAYFITLSKWEKYKSLPWKVIIALAGIFALSYPLLSSDVFKYLFAAKELIIYHANPHIIAPQVFEGDTWLRFMRWIHTPSPYGPVMTLLAIPPYLLGLGKFVPALFLFKLTQVFWYLLSIWLIGKLAAKRPVLAQLAFAFNPLILVEWLVNAHNDAPMIAFLLLSMYLWQKGKSGLSLLSLLLSGGIKYVTVIFLPVIIFAKQLKNKNLFVVYYLFIVFAIAPILYHYSYQYQPWYVTWLVPFAALSGSSILISLTTAYTIGAFLRYLPFIGLGVWQGTSLYFALLTFTPLILISIYFLVIYFYRHYVAQMKKKQL